MDNNQIPHQEDEIEINLFNYLIVLLKHKEFIIKTTLAVTFAAAVFSLLVPPSYLSETKVLPPQSGNSSMASIMASQLGGLGMSPAAFGVKNTNELYIALLKTRGVTDFVTEKLDLMKSYKLKSRENMRKLLVNGLTVRNDIKSGIITLGFEHRNPQMAADIANAFVEGLQHFNNNLAVTEASQRRLFFEEQLKTAKENLIQSEESLKSFQQRTGTIKIDEEARGVIETVAKMRAEVSGKEVELRVMKAYATPENPDMQRLQTETAALKEELLKLESKTSLGDDSVPTVGKMSVLGTEYVRKMRDYRYNEALYEIFLKQFEAAKIDESKDAALVQIVEKAEAPEKRFKPQRQGIVVRAFFLALFLTVVFVFFKGYCQSLTADPETKKKIQQTKSYLDFSQLIKDLKLEKIAEKIGVLFSKLQKK
ncbi:MAG: Wzz/FepE/Etk N-terminal domain-containing protein [Elusimicrobia bacterium]|nr:Wzz/FepE/Etk N-terminal domain-containing protein [Elusimicrobiota bacterium]